MSCCFFFSSRRRHTRSLRDWSSDVCSSDLRRVYEGQLSEADWSALGGILDSKEFRELKVPASVAPLVVENSHPYTISVARDKGFQNMEFLNNHSRKPYESQLKPLLQWWKSLRSAHLPESNASPDSRCSLDSTN